MRRGRGAIRGGFQTPKGVCLIGALRLQFLFDLLQKFQTPKGVCLIGASSLRRSRRTGSEFQTPKGVCLIGAANCGVKVGNLCRIPDAERRLPHWSQIVLKSKVIRFYYSRRRKASASLEHHSTAFYLGGQVLFQTPKGVCLIGAAKRRVRVPRQIGFQTPKGVCLIGAFFPKDNRRFAAIFQTPKGVCLIGARGTGSKSCNR